MRFVIRSYFPVIGFFCLLSVKLSWGVEREIEVKGERERKINIDNDQFAAQIATNASHSITTDPRVTHEISVCSNPAQATPVSTLINKVSYYLREAVEAADLSVEAGEGDTKSVASAAQIRYQKKCFVAIEEACKALKELGGIVSSEEYQNSGGVGLPQKGAAYAANRTVSEYLQDVKSLGIGQLGKDLLAWKQRIVDAHGVIQDADIKSAQNYNKELPDLMSCALFWQQLQHDAAPCFKECSDIIHYLDTLESRAASIAKGSMNLTQRMVDEGGLVPENGTCLRRLLNWIGFTQSKKDQDKQVIRLSVAVEFAEKFQVLLTKLDSLLEITKRLKKTVLPGQFMVTKKFNEDLLLSKTQQDIEALQKEIRELYATSDDEITNYGSHINMELTITDVRNVIHNSIKKITYIDNDLREAMAGIGSVAGLTTIQRNYLENIRIHDSLFRGEGLHQQYVSCIESIKKLLPQKNIDGYWKALAEHTEKFENGRGNPRPFRELVGVAVSGNQSKIVQYLDLVRTVTAIEWLASEGFPCAISHITSAGKDISEAVTNFEKARTALALEFKNIKSMEQRLFPSRSLHEYVNWQKNATCKQSYKDKRRAIFNEYAHRIEQSTTESALLGIIGNSFAALQLAIDNVKGQELDNSLNDEQREVYSGWNWLNARAIYKFNNKVSLRNNLRTYLRQITNSFELTPASLVALKSIHNSLISKNCICSNNVIQLKSELNTSIGNLEKFLKLKEESPRIRERLEGWQRSNTDEVRNVSVGSVCLQLEREGANQDYLGRCEDIWNNVLSQYPIGTNTRYVLNRDLNPQSLVPYLYVSVAKREFTIAKRKYNSIKNNWEKYTKEVDRINVHWDNEKKYRQAELNQIKKEMPWWKKLAFYYYTSQEQRMPWFLKKAQVVMDIINDADSHKITPPDPLPPLDQRTRILWRDAKRIKRDWFQNNPSVNSDHLMDLSAIKRINKEYFNCPLLPRAAQVVQPYQRA